MTPFDSSPDSVWQLSRLISGSARTSNLAALVTHSGSSVTHFASSGESFWQFSQLIRRPSGSWIIIMLCHKYSETSSFVQLRAHLIFKTIKKKCALLMLRNIVWNYMGSFCKTKKQGKHIVVFIRLSVLKSSSGRNVHTYN